MHALQTAHEIRFAAGREPYRRSRRFACHPAKRLDIARDAADRVSRTAQQIDGAVAVVVHGVTAVARRHELRQPDRARIRTLDDERIDLRFARQQQQLLQLVAEVVLAANAVEGDRRERIDGAERARVAAIGSLDAEDSQDDFRRNAEFRFGARQVV
jgi:hypothetical protein